MSFPKEEIMKNKNIIGLVVLAVVFLFGCGKANGGEIGVVAFVSTQDGDAEIYVIEIDGSNEQKLTDNDVSDSSPVWSPASP